MIEDIQKKMIQQNLALTVGVFVDENGMSEHFYNKTYDNIRKFLGEDVASEFAKLIDATDGKFYANDEKALALFIEKYFC